MEECRPLRGLYLVFPRHNLGIARTPNHCFDRRQSAVRDNALYEDDSFSFDFQNFINRLILFPFFFSIFSGESG